MDGVLWLEGNGSTPCGSESQHWRLRQEDGELQVTLGYVVSSVLKKGVVVGGQQKSRECQPDEARDRVAAGVEVGEGGD